MTEAAVDRLPNVEAGVECHEVLFVEIGGGNESPSRQSVRRITDEHHGLGAPGQHGEGPIGWRVGEDTQVGLIVQDRLNHLVRVKVFEAHPGLGEHGHEPLGMGAHDVDADRVDRRDTDDADNLGASGGDGAAEAVKSIEELLAPLIELMPLGRQHEGPLAAVDEEDVHVGFELLHGLAGSRLGHLIEGGTLREAVQPDDIAVELEHIQIHAAYPIE